MPIAAVLAALVLGGVLIASEGSNPLAVYGDVLDGVFVANRGLSNTAVAARGTADRALDVVTALVGDRRWCRRGRSPGRSAHTRPDLDDDPALVFEMIVRLAGPGDITAVWVDGRRVV